MSRLRIVQAGPGLSLQDFGRIGWRRFGISTAGAMDRLHLAIANRLVGNSVDMAALETTLLGFGLVVDEGPVLVAVSGSGLAMAVDGATVPCGQSALVQPGQTITVPALRDGVYGYLAVAGGFDVAPVLGSLSTHRRSEIFAASLSVGVSLDVAESQWRSDITPLRIPMIPRHTIGPIRIIAGPQDDWFDADALARLTSADWQVGVRSDRMGVFLDGPRIDALPGSMVSDGVLPGSIQLPPLGAPIVLMRDCQTTGGYPKIATVISADLDRLSQYRVGQLLQFELVTQEEAVAALRARKAALDGIQTERAVRTPDATWLLSRNLIDGAWAFYPDATDDLIA
jgi:biotin-dependent carboxylase-like uncharacterized protein